MCSLSGKQRDSTQKHTNKCSVLLKMVKNAFLVVKKTKKIEKNRKNFKKSLDNGQKWLYNILITISTRRNGIFNGRRYGMFKGMFEHQLDDKNRLRIPSKFKKELTGENGEKSYSFFRGMNRCICVMADEDLDDTIASISEEAISESNQASAMFFSSIFSAEEDAQGRVVLPTMLKKMAGIQKDIVTIGRGKRLEIWAAEKYYEYLEGIDYDSELKKLGI